MLCDFFVLCDLSLILNTTLAPPPRPPPPHPHPHTHVYARAHNVDSRTRLTGLTESCCNGRTRCSLALAFLTPVDMMARRRRTSDYFRDPTLCALHPPNRFDCVPQGRAADLVRSSLSYQLLITGMVLKTQPGRRLVRVHIYLHTRC